MPLKTPEQYEESLRKMKFKAYLLGEGSRMRRQPHPSPLDEFGQDDLRAGAGSRSMQELMTATSSLTGKKINRFCHLHQSPEDLVKKVKMQRLMGQKTAACYQRCVGMDAINAVDSVTFEMDQKLGTEYHKRFRKFLLRMQEEDWTVDGAMTDVKGDRNLNPGKQADPDLFAASWRDARTASSCGAARPTRPGRLTPTGSSSCRR